MDEILKRIRNNTKKNSLENKKDWYKAGKALVKGEKIEWHKESKVAARRVYRFYTLGKGDWNGPTPRTFAKMGRKKFEEKLEQRRQQKEDEILNEISELISNFEGEDLLGMEPHEVTDHVTESRGWAETSEESSRQIDDSTPVITNQISDGH